MFIYTINKKDPRLMTADNWGYVGKKMLLTENAQVAIRHFINTNYPDVGQYTSMEPCPIPRFDSNNPDHIKKLEEGAHVLFSRAGGAGDIIMIAPIIQSMKKRYPKTEVTFAMDSKHSVIAQMLDAVDHVQTYPIVEDVFKDFDMYCSFYGTIEMPSDKSREMHGTDLFAEHIGWEFDESDSMLASLTTPAKSVRRIKKLYVREGIPEDATVVVVQFRASNVNRAFDLSKMSQVIGKLAGRENTHILVVGGAPEECGFQWKTEDGSKPYPTIHKILGELTWRETAALVAKADLCIGPDSAIVHLSGILGTPCVALYGPFPPEIRTKYYAKCVPIMSKAECAPCFSHGTWACSHLLQRLNDMTDDEGNAPAWAPAPCWDSITVDEVLQAISNILDNKQEDNKEE